MVTWSFWRIKSFRNAKQSLFTQQHTVSKSCFVSRIHKLWICFCMTFLLRGLSYVWSSRLCKLWEVEKCGCVYFTRGHTGKEHSVTPVPEVLDVTLFWNGSAGWLYCLLYEIYRKHQRMLCMCLYVCVCMDVFVCMYLVISVSWGGFPMPQVHVRYSWVFVGIEVRI